MSTQTQNQINIIKEFSPIFPRFIGYVESISKKPIKSGFFTQKQISKLLLEYIKNEKSWDKSGNKTSFNQIQKLIRNNVVKDVIRNVSKNYSYLELVDGTIFNIRKQDEFHFTLVAKIYKYLKKHNHTELLNELFIESDDDLFVNQDLIQIEKSEITKDNFHYRTDMFFEIKNKRIVVEYLEKQHEKEKSLDYPYEKYRAFNLMFDNKNIDKEIVHIAYYWDHQYNDDKYFKKFVKNLCNKFVDYWDIADKDKFCIRKLSKVVGNQSLAEQLYMAHSNVNEPIVRLDSIEKLIKWNNNINSNLNHSISISKLWYDEFVDKVKQYVFLKNQNKKSLDGFDDFEDSDDDDDSDNIVQNKQIIGNNQISHELFYSIKDIYIGSDSDNPDNSDDNYEPVTFLTQSGLHLYLSVELQYLSDISEYFRLRKFYENITQGLVDIINEFREKELKLKEHLIAGLEY